MTVHHPDLTVDWFGYATARLDSPDGPTVSLDPGRYGVLTGEWEPHGPDLVHPPTRDYDARDGDVVCVTHDHHYDSDGIRRVASEDATLVVYEAVDPSGIDRDVEPIDDLPYDVVRIGQHEEFSVRDVSVETVPAHNVPGGPRSDEDGTPNHPEGFGCGFLVTLGDVTAFYPGDSDVLDEHADLDVDVFLPPISGALTMDRHEAAELAAALEPDLVVPIHYDTFETLESDALAFAADVASRGIPVALDA